MSLLEMVVPDEASVHSGSFLQKLSQSVSNITCGSREGECRDDSYALILKLIAIGLILISGVCGVAVPLIGRKHRFLSTDSNLFVASKAFAAGVILATGFVHMLSDANSALSNPCLPEFPWSKFPFPGFIAMLSSLATLLADFLGTQYYERRQESPARRAVSDEDSEDLLSESRGGNNNNNGIIPVHGAKASSEEEGDSSPMHIVGMHAHAAQHRHSHSHGDERRVSGDDSHSHSHSHSHSQGIDEVDGSIRHIVVSQVLELGIVSHSVIIGLSLGVSHSPCTVRPLIGALSFHQFFEGFALGGCISQARFKTLRSTAMACFFALTTPLGIAAGIGLSSITDAYSPRALVVEGTFDSISAGILVYMALVDLIAADFLSKRMSCDFRLQVGCYFALFLGALLMSSLAMWA